MENLSPQTRFTGRQVLFLPVCSSTNTVAQELINKNEATEGFVIIAGEQTSGRGQRGNSWESAAGLNLMLSVVYKPDFLAATEQFYLSMAVSLGVSDFLKRFLPAGVVLKWPNDLYFNEEKLGGILIENTISGTNLQHAVIGIGLNVNQVFFQQPRAVSMKLISCHTYDLKTLAEALLECLEKRYLELPEEPHHALQQEYWSQLLGLNGYRFFEVEGQRITGKITGTDPYGRLLLETESGLQTFDMKGIRFLFE